MMDLKRVQERAAPEAAEKQKEGGIERKHGPSVSVLTKGRAFGLILGLLATVAAVKLTHRKGVELLDSGKINLKSREGILSGDVASSDSKVYALKRGGTELLKGQTNAKKSGKLVSSGQNAISGFELPDSKLLALKRTLHRSRARLLDDNERLRLDDNDALEEEKGLERLLRREEGGAGEVAETRGEQGTRGRDSAYPRVGEGEIQRGHVDTGRESAIHRKGHEGDGGNFVVRGGRGASAVQKCMLL